MNTIRICQQCRKPLPHNAREELCPECAVAVTRAPRRFAGLRVWVWPLITIALALAAIYVPPPGTQPEPSDIASMFRPAPVLLTPHGNSYRVVTFERFRDFNQVYAVGLVTTETTTVTRQLGVNPAHLGFFKTTTRRTYQLAASRFDSNRPPENPWLSAPEVAKIKPLVVAELNRRSADHLLGQRLSEVLQSGVVSDCPRLCLQNVIVLAAWCALALSLLAFAALLIPRRKAL